MKDITVRTDPEDLESVYLEAHETREHIESLNSSLDLLEPILDSLDSELEVNKSKRTRVKAKLVKIVAKL